MAAIRGRGYVEPDDVKQIVPAVLGHRVILQPEARLQNVSVDELLVGADDEWMRGGRGSDAGTLGAG